MPDNIQTLKALMAEHDLSRRQVATLLRVYKQRVDSWCMGNRQMPDQLLELLQYKIKDK